MKKVFKPMLLLLFFVLSNTSCNNEELFVEPIVDVEEDPKEEPDNEDEDDNSSDIPALPCDFDLSGVVAGEEVTINCILDLGNATINLPEDVTFLFENGGDIINGTLNFSGGTIDGHILNSSLTITGNAQVKDHIFDFFPGRWGIIEGVVNDDVALNNKNILNDLFAQANGLGIETFKINALDAYFLVSKESNHLPQWNRGDIFIPSNFKLEMTDNTHLRVQPNSYSFFVLLSVLDATNVTISGGNLHGDRDTHDYTGYGGASGHGDSSLVSLNAAVNTVVENVNMYDSTGDGVIVASLGFSFDADYKPSYNSFIKGCLIDKSRRNNISIVNGHHITVEDCQILNAGVTTSNSVGTLPRLGIDVEALRSRDDKGNLILYEIARDIIIKNNVERGSDNGGFLVAIGDDVTIEGNDMENYIGYDIATGVKIRNNTITGTLEKHLTTFAIGAAGPGSTTTYGNEVSGNTIKGYGTGITAYCYDAKIFGNTITDFNTAIFIPNMSNTDIYENTLTSTKTGSRGIAAFIATMENCNIYDNNINVTSYPVSFINVNLEPGEEQFSVNVYDNTFNAPREAQVSNSIGVVLTDNK